MTTWTNQRSLKVSDERQPLADPYAAKAHACPHFGGASSSSSSRIYLCNKFKFESNFPASRLGLPNANRKTAASAQQQSTM